MSSLRFVISMSLDGYVAGPNQSARVIGSPSVTYFKYRRKNE